MANYDLDLIRDYLQRSDSAATTDAKGEIFEDLVIYLFTQCSGVSFADRNILDNTGAREFDVALRNRSTSEFDFLDSLIICECKNEVGPIGSNQVRDFHTKLRTSGASNGLIIASRGISGQIQGNNRFATTAIVDAMVMDKIKILVITREDILSLVTTEDLEELIWQRFSTLSLKRRM